MRKIILMMGISLDGFIEGPNREIDWHSGGDDYTSHVDELLAGMGAFLHGRRVYELMAAFWPAARSDPSSTQRNAKFGRLWCEMPKIVFSKTLQRAEWNTTVSSEVVPEQIRALQSQPGGDMVVGGAGLGASFMEQDLIDEYRIYVHPTLIGQGRPLFGPSAKRIPLRIAETRTFASGVVLLRYERAAAGVVPVNTAN